MSTRRVVVTGIGVITPIGLEIPVFWQNLLDGKSGITYYEPFGEYLGSANGNYECLIAGEIKNFNAPMWFNNQKDARRTDRFSQFAMAGAKKALLDSGIDLAKVNRERFGVIIGSGIGGLKSLQVASHKLFTSGPEKVSPFTICMLLTNMASGLVSMEFNLTGPNMSIVTACAASNNSIGEAWRNIKMGDADIFLTGGAEAAINPIGIAGFSALRALSNRNHEPEKASRPFDRDRDGFVMGEGSGIIVLEELEHAKKRGAEIYCELAGYGANADAHHMTAPLPEGLEAARCMRIAMHHAQVNPEDIDYINAHGTSTILGDICETKAIKKALGNCAYHVPISSTKSMTGHLLGAAGGIELAATILTIKHGIIPPTINMDTSDPECDLDYVPNVAREKKVDIAISNSFGFGGHNATLLVKRFTE